MSPTFRLISLCIVAVRVISELITVYIKESFYVIYQSQPEAKFNRITKTIYQTINLCFFGLWIILL